MLDMSNSNVEAVTSFVEEVIDETVGRSSKKWALVLLARGWSTRRALADPRISLC